jgi:hypothetical protein
MKIQPIVEGHGDAAAVPVLLRRLLERRGSYAEVKRPLRVPKSQLVREPDLRRVVQLAAKYTGPGDAILLLADADDDCPATLGPRLLEWARAERPDRRIGVVLATREFEAWYLAAIPSLVRSGKLPATTETPATPETIRDAKGWLSRQMQRRYSETVDQPAFAAQFDLEAALGCRSFDKLRREVDALLELAS